MKTRLKIALALLTASTVVAADTHERQLRELFCDAYQASFTTDQMILESVEWATNHQWVCDSR